MVDDKSMAHPVASLGSGEGGPPRVTPSRGGDTRMKFKKNCAEFRKKTVYKRGRTAKKGHHFADCDD